MPRSEVFRYILYISQLPTSIWVDRDFSLRTTIKEDIRKAFKMCFYNLPAMKGQWLFK